MKLLRLVLSDLHLVTGSRPGQLDPFEDFFHDDRFAELLAHYSQDDEAEVELILNGDIFDLLKVRIEGKWPIEVTDEIATEKLRLCLEGHPVFVRALKRFLDNPRHRITYLPGNHDLDMWFEGPQELFRRYIAPGEAAERVRFVTNGDTYYLPEGIQIRHGHQFERIHRVDYSDMVIEKPDGRTILRFPWGSLWILEVMNPLKEFRSHIDRIQPLGRFMWASVFLDPVFVFRFFYHSTWYFLKHRVFHLQAWVDRIRSIPRLVREELFELTDGYDEQAARALNRIRGAHTLIVGHSHGPRFLQLPSGKTLVNTGTWVKMINLDLKYLGQDSGLTYALIDYNDDGKPRTQLMRWLGHSEPLEVVPFAD
ncbi:MAG: metallophosphoesterase [Myxococcota bacterium]